MSHMKNNQMHSVAFTVLSRKHTASLFTLTLQSPPAPVFSSYAIYHLGSEVRCVISSVRLFIYMHIRGDDVHCNTTKNNSVEWAIRRERRCEDAHRESVQGKSTSTTIVVPPDSSEDVSSVRRVCGGDMN